VVFVAVAVVAAGGDAVETAKEMKVVLKLVLVRPVVPVGKQQMSLLLESSISA
jgi:hypothetical protein